MMPYKPIRYEFNIPFYSSLDLETYGPPDLYGTWQYMVIEAPETSHPYTTDYHLECERRLRPIHRYDRSERFYEMISHLMGWGKISDDVMDIIYEEFGLENLPPWESVERILSRNKLTKYVNRIPIILRILGWDTLLKNKINIPAVIGTLHEMSIKFDQDKGHRKYFPKMRYICLRVMLEAGAKLSYDVPLIKTNCKIIPLDLIYKKLRSSYSSHITSI